MTNRLQAGARAAAIADGLSQPTEEALSMRERHNDRAHLWRLALGGLGLFWVCVLILLMS